MSCIVAALYQFTPFADPAAIRTPLREVCEAGGAKGTLLIAGEGINGTIAGTRAAVDAVLAHIRALPGCAGLEVKESHAEALPFHRMKVRLKREIVTMGQPHVNPLASVGTYVEAQDWNALIARDDVVVIDTRNDYEVVIGTFAGAVDPATESFSEFPGWWAENSARFRGKKVAMFCTGGIRCEKASNYLLGEGVAEVFHLRGGVLKYLESVTKAQSTWQGDCFVFDARVSVGHGLEEGPHLLCYACRRPILPEDTRRPEFEKGVSCHQCIHEIDETRKSGFRERQKQVELAEERGERHIG